MASRRSHLCLRSSRRRAGNVYQAVQGRRAGTGGVQRFTQGADERLRKTFKRVRAMFKWRVCLNGIKRWGLKAEQRVASRLPFPLTQPLDFTGSALRG